MFGCYVQFDPDENIQCLDYVWLGVSYFKPDFSDFFPDIAGLLSSRDIT